VLKKKRYRLYEVEGSPRSRWKRIVLWSSVGLVLVILMVAAGSYLWFRAEVSSANDRVTPEIRAALQEKPSTTLTTEPSLAPTGATTSTEVRKEPSPSAMNLLVIGSDRRSNDPSLGGRSDTLMIVHVDPDQGFNIIYSSGTTGAPKGIVQPHRMRWGQIRRGIYNEQSVTMISTPLYSNTTLVSFLPTLSNGGTAVLMPKFDVKGFLELAQANRATHAMLVPVQYRRLMEYPEFDNYDLSSFQMKFSTWTKSVAVLISAISLANFSFPSVNTLTLLFAVKMEPLFSRSIRAILRSGAVIWSLTWMTVPSSFSSFSCDLMISPSRRSCSPLTRNIFSLVYVCPRKTYRTKPTTGRKTRAITHARVALGSFRSKKMTMMMKMISASTMRGNRIFHIDIASTIIRPLV
jgi:hypothetical protein